MKYTDVLLLALFGLTAASVLHHREGVSTYINYWNRNGYNNKNNYNGDDKNELQGIQELFQKKKVALKLLPDLQQDIQNQHLNNLGNNFNPHQAIKQFNVGHRIDNTIKEKVDLRGTKSLEVEQQNTQNQKKINSKPRVRRQYNPDNIAIAKLFLAIRQHRTGNPQLDKIERIKKLLDQIQNINDVDLNDNNNTPLHVAVTKGHTELVKLLLSKQAGINIENKAGKTPIDIAKQPNTLNGEEILQILNSPTQQVSVEEQSASQQQLQHKRTRTDSKEIESEDSNSTRQRVSFQTKKQSGGTKRNQNEGDDSEGSEKKKKGSEQDLLDNRLIENENDVTFVNKDSNTPLHCAVIKGDRLEVIQLLKNNEVIMSKENSENETPLDIAIRLNKRGIIKILEDKILNNLLQNLRSLNLKEPQLISSHAPNEEGGEKIEERIKRKVEFSLEALKELTNDENDIRRFTYKNANIFVLFLEAFALQDVEINEILSEDEKNKLIEQYFRGEDNKIIKDLRGKLTHREGRDIVFYPQYLENFVVKTTRKLDVGKFFNDLKDYVQEVYDKLSGQQSGLNKKDIKEILEPTSEQKIKKKKTVFELFRDLVNVAYSKNFNSEEQEKVMFDLTVNIIPSIGEDLKKEFKELKNLRNDLIHNFHKFSSLTSRKNELTKAIFHLRSKIFKYYSSKKIYDNFRKAQPDQETGGIIDDVGKELESLEKEFRQKIVTLSEEEARGSFENVFSESLFSEKDGDITDLVKKYLRFMAVIEDEERGLTDEGIEISERYKELNDLERREIFEDFVELEEIFKKIKEEESYEQQYKEKKEELKNRCGEYGVEESSFDKVIKLSVEGNNVFDKEIEDKISSIVKSLMSLKHSKDLQEYLLSNQDIISLCNHFMKEKDISHLNNHEDLLRNYGFSDKTKQLIEERFSNLLKEDKTTNILSSMRVQINVAKVVNNILKIFYNAYHKYQIKFDNVKGAFSDKIFLDFLVSQDVNIDREKSFKFKNEDYVFRIIKKLLKVEYMAPYIASLIIKVQSDMVIEEDDLRRLIEMLLKENMHTTYLNELLYVKSKKPNFNLYEAICEFLEKGEINAESIRVILGDTEHAGKILDILGKRIDSANDHTSSNPSSDATIKLAKQVLKLLNDVVLELIYKGKTDSALEILGCKDKSDSSISKEQSLYQKLVSKELIEKSDDLVVDNKLNIAKVKNFQGEDKGKQGKNEEAKKLYKEALEVLEGIPVTNSPRSLLALSRKGYTYSLLQKYDESYKEYDDLYKKVKKLALGEASTTKPDSKEIYNEIKKSKKYQDLLNSSDECRKYLTIAGIRKSIAYTKFMQNRSKREQEPNKICEDILKKYNEVLSLQKEDPGKEYKSILPTRRKIAYMHKIIGEKKIELAEYWRALQYNYRALEEENKILEKEIEIYGNCHPGIRKTSEFIKKVLSNIAYAHYKLAQAYNRNQSKGGNLDKAKENAEENLKILKILKDEGYKDAEKHYSNAESLLRKIQKTNKSNSLLTECLPKMKKREAENECLFTWDDVDEFNEGKGENRDFSKIKIDGEKFVNYIKYLPERNQNQLIQLADEVTVAGRFQGLVNKLTSNQKIMNHLSMVRQISGMTLHGTMAKNVLADFLNRDYQGVAINVGFIAGGQGFAKVAEAASLKGLKLASERKLLLGRSLRAASPFLARGTSAFVVYDLVNQVKAFKNGTEESLVGVVGDAIYLGVDAAEIGIEIAEVFEVLEGVSSVTGPIGAAIGTVVFIGTDIYMAVKRVDKIDQIIHLKENERFIEGLRAFIGMQPENYIEELVEEKQLNDQLVKLGLEYLKQHSDVQKYVFPTKKIVCHHVINNKTVCVVPGTYDGICIKHGVKTFYTEECTPVIEMNSRVILDAKQTDIKWNRAKPDNPDGGQVFCLPQGDYEPAPSYGSYLCKSAIGITDLSANKTAGYTLFNLGEGEDNIRGFTDSRNIFVVNNGSKEYYGGDKDDIFVLQAGYVKGYLSGEGGVNTLDTTSFGFQKEPLNIQLDKGEIVDYLRDNWLKVCDVNKVIGRANRADTITVSCNGCNSNVKLIDGQSGDIEIKDEINIINNHCSYQMQIIVRSNTVIYNRALEGNFDYLVPLNDGGSAEFIFIYGPERFNVNNTFWFGYEPVNIKSIDVRYVNIFNRTEHEVNFNFIKSDKEFNVTISYPEHPSYMLGSSGEIKIGNKDYLYMLQSSNESAEEIIKNYLPLSNRLIKMSFFIQSLLNNETVVIGGRNHEVIHNNPIYKSHLVGNGGENVYVIDFENKRFEVPVPEVIIYDLDIETSVDTIDLRSLVQQARGKLSNQDDFQLKVLKSANDLLLKATVVVMKPTEDSSVNKTINHEYCTVRLKDGVNWYNKTHVIVDNTPMKINLDDNQWSLKPLPLTFEKDKEVIIVTSQDIEENTELITPKRAGNYSFVRDHGNDLIVTNAFNDNVAKNDICTIILSNFYKEPKMATLSIKFADEEIILEDHQEEISTARDVNVVKKEYRDQVYNDVFNYKKSSSEVIMQ